MDMVVVSLVLLIFCFVNDIQWRYDSACFDALLYDYIDVMFVCNVAISPTTSHTQKTTAVYASSDRALCIRLIPYEKVEHLSFS
jgi:hypothetical protein